MLLPTKRCGCAKGFCLVLLCQQTSSKRHGSPADCSLQALCTLEPIVPPVKSAAAWWKDWSQATSPDRCWFCLVSCRQQEENKQCLATLNGKELRGIALILDSDTPEQDEAPCQHDHSDTHLVKPIWEDSYHAVPDERWGMAWRAMCCSTIYLNLSTSRYSGICHIQPSEHHQVSESTE